MAPNGNAGRIPRTNFIIASIILFVLSVISTIGRIAIRLHYQRSLAVDDAFLIFALMCLIVALALAFAVISPMYLVEALITNDPNVSIPSDIFEQVTRLRKLNTTFNVLTFTTIFAVKFSFLFLFKALIRNVRKMSIYWWTVVVTTAAVWAFGIVEFFILCPISGPESLNCEQESKRTKVLGWSVAIIVEDVLTDLMIIAIPVLLLWRIQIKLQQKLALGFSLCLSIIVIITAIVKISGIYTPTKTTDVSWEIFWQLMEACIAVIMVSLTAFRSLFVAYGSGARSHPQKPPLQNRLLSSRTAARKKQRGENDSEELERLPDIPLATLTGMRTFIRGKHAGRSVITIEGPGDTELPGPLGDGSADQTIRVQHDMWQKSENASAHTKGSSDDQFV